MSQVVIVALYRFVSLPDYREWQQPLRALCEGLGIKGTLLLAHEGINGTVSGSQEAVDRLLEYLKADPRLAALEHKVAYEESQPFYRLKIKLKKEIVTLGVENIDPLRDAGTYVTPEAWNRLLEDPEVTVIDTRNDYEYRLGTFAGAINPRTESFRELPRFVAEHLDPAKHKKVAMFCTGGIRCEKSTAYLRQQGFEEVYHLQGGILKYLEEVPEEQSLWRGECFVFDNRVSVNHRLEKGQYELCHGCWMASGPDEKASDKYLEGVACSHCYDTQTEDQRTRFSERQKQIDLARQRNQRHIGRVHVGRKSLEDEGALGSQKKNVPG